MFGSNDLKTASRNLWKHKTFSGINIIGLSIGLTSFILIALFIFDELTFDGMHQHAQRIYRVVEQKTAADGQRTKRSATGFQVSARAQTSFPEIQTVARISTYWRPEIRPGNLQASVFHEDFVAANPGFLELFSFPLLYGNRKTALTKPKSVLLTEATAQKYFGSADVLGKPLYFDNDSVPYTVTGILQNFPANSSISCNLLVSESSILSVPEARQHFDNDWNSGGFTTFFLLRDKTAVAALPAKLESLIAANHSADPGVNTRIQLQALQDIHFYSNDIEGHSGKKGNITYIYVFLIVACFIIFIACINYMNLSTAKFTNRGKEIAVRKVSGASRATLIKQFLAEAFLVTILSVGVSLLLVLFLLPAFNAFTEKQLSIGIHTDYRIWIGLLFTILLVTLSAGLYPALFQSGLHPLALLKSKIQLGRNNISLRKSLVVLQFTISIVLIAATLIIYQQMRYVQIKDMGFDKDQLVVIDINSGAIRRSGETLKAEFAKIPQVKSTTITSTVPGAWTTIPTVEVIAAHEPVQERKDMFFFGVDGQFLPTYAMQLVNGRNFFPGGNADSSAVLINETAARLLGITEAKGQAITILSAKFGSDNRSSVEKPFTLNLAGIVKDFHFQSLHEPLRPVVMGYDKILGLSFGHLTVKLSGSNIDATLDKINTILHRIDPGHLFAYHFLDKQWELLYREDKIRHTLFLIVSFLAIFIAALGLLGLSIYAAEQRVKEVGIRKILGANMGSIALMLSKDFLKLVLIAAMVAVPIAWLLMQRWLNDFAYRINISAWVFIVAAIVALIIALATISLQVFKAAVASPVKSLRND